MSTETQERPLRVLIVGSNQRSVDMAEKIKQDPNSHFVGFADDKKHLLDDIVCVCKLEDIEQYVSSNSIDEILVTLPVRTFYEKNLSLLKKSEKLGVKVRVCGHLFDLQCDNEACLADNIKTFVKNIFNPKKKRVLIVGLNVRALSLAENIRCNCRSHEFVGFADDANQQELASMSVRCDLNNIEDYIVNRQIDEVFISLPVKSFYDKIISITEVCKKNNVSVKVLDDFFNTDEAVPPYIDSGEKIPTIDFLLLAENV